MKKLNIEFLIELNMLFKVASYDYTTSLGSQESGLTTGIASESGVEFGEEGVFGEAHGTWEHGEQDGTGVYEEDECFGAVDEEDPEREPEPEPEPESEPEEEEEDDDLGQYGGYGVTCPSDDEDDFNP